MARYRLRDAVAEIRNNQDALNQALDQKVESVREELGPLAAITDLTVGDGPLASVFRGVAMARFSVHLRRVRRAEGDDRTLLEIFLDWLSNGGMELIIQLITLIIGLF